MNPVPPLPFPGSRTVAAWWRELAPHRPLRLWLCHLLLHRVEALAEVQLTRPLNGLRLEVLRSVAAGCTPEGLDPGCLDRLTRELIATGIFARIEAGLQPTEAGRRALATGTAKVDSLERRTFTFVDNGSLACPPHFIHVRRPGDPVAPPASWEFDPTVLQKAAPGQASWKRRFGFPEEVRAVRLPEADEPDWRAVLFDQAEHLFAAFIEVKTNDATSSLRGFAARAEGWTLDASEPAVEIGEGWGEALPDLAAEPGEDLLRTAWQAWGQQRGLPIAETRECRLELSGSLLQVEAPRRLMNRLRETRSDALKGEAWLLAGTGRSRAAVRVQLADRES